MTALPVSLLAAPLVLVAAAWYYSKLVSTSSQSTAEALVRWLYLLASRLQAIAEAYDSAVEVYRAVLARPISPGCEHMRGLRETEAHRRDEERCLVSLYRKEPA